MAPILPGLSDRPELLENVVRAARDAGAAHIWAKLLYLQPGTREHFLDSLAREWPEQLPLYEQLYRHGAYLRSAETRPVLERIDALRREYGIGQNRFRMLRQQDAGPRRSGTVSRTRVRAARRAAAGGSDGIASGPGTPAQLALALG